MTEDVYRLQEMIKIKARKVLHDRIMEVMREEKSRFCELAAEIGIGVESGIESRGFIKNIIYIQAETLFESAKRWMEEGDHQQSSWADFSREVRYGR